MPAREIVAVAMSGGVDSSLAAALLLEKNYAVAGVTLQMQPPALPGRAEEQSGFSQAVEDARRVCRLLGIPHHAFDFQDVFAREVIDYFCREYLQGRTPNPCVVCNRKIKFQALWEKSLNLGASYMATGHYVRRVYDEQRDRWLLLRARDKKKDQSYVLYSLTQEQLSRSLFPLGEYSKEEARRKAARLRLAVADKPESQEICFIPDNDYRRFLRQYAPQSLKPGPIVDRKGNVWGRHKGIAFYTIGQRKGLGIAAPRPLYVVDICPAESKVVVGEVEETCSRSLLAENVNLLVPFREDCREVEARIRYNAPAAPAVLRRVPEGILTEFYRPQQAVTPGQSVVWYSGDLVIGGGVIARSVKA